MSSQPQSSRSFAKKVFWIITSTILVLIFIVILLSVLGGGAWSVSELQRSFNSLQTQIDANEQNLDSLQSLVNSEFEAGAPRKQQRELNSLQDDVSSLDNDLETLQADLVLDLDVQTQQLDALEEALATAVSNAETTEFIYSEGLLTLQMDLNQSNQQLDDLGGNIDTLQNDLSTTDTAVSNLETAYTENAITPQELQYTIALFRAWEMIARARLRLLENNFGLAANDSEQALRTVDYLLANNAGENPDTLRIIQTRLALALSNLPDQPEQARKDLETAWSEIDTLLILATFPEEDTAVFLNISTEEATPEPDN